MVAKQLDDTLAKYAVTEIAAEGQEFDSIFLSAIFNSIPYADDRAKVLRIAASMATRGRTGLHAGAESNRQVRLLMTKGAKYVSEDGAGSHMRLDYEPGILISNLFKQPKVQKHYSLTEWQALWEGYFDKVETAHAVSPSVLVRARDPKPVRWSELEEALRFEFDLPYPNGDSLDLADEAVAAWEARGELLGKFKDVEGEIYWT